MKDYELLYQLKDLERHIAIYLAKDKPDCEKFSPPTPTQIRIVSYILKRDKDNIYQRDLEKELNLTRATLSGVLKTMEKNGIISRVVNVSDARSKKIILNDKLQNLFLESQEKLKAAEKILTEDVGNRELEIFISVLNKMKENIKKENIN